jgi:hypothetical protein
MTIKAYVEYTVRLKNGMILRGTKASIARQIFGLKALWVVMRPAHIIYVLVSKIRGSK